MAGLSGASRLRSNSLISAPAMKPRPAPMMHDGPDRGIGDRRFEPRYQRRAKRVAGGVDRRVVDDEQRDLAHLLLLTRAVPSLIAGKSRFAATEGLKRGRVSVKHEAENAARRARAKRPAGGDETLLRRYRGRSAGFAARAGGGPDQDRHAGRVAPAHRLQRQSRALFPRRLSDRRRPHQRARRIDDRRRQISSRARGARQPIRHQSGRAAICSAVNP